MLAFGFLYVLFIKLRNFPSILIFVRFFFFWGISLYSNVYHERKVESGPADSQHIHQLDLLFKNVDGWESVLWTTR